MNIIGRSAIEASDDPEETRAADARRRSRSRSTPTSPPETTPIDDVIDPRETRPTIIAACAAAGEMAWSTEQADVAAVVGKRSTGIVPSSAPGGLLSRFETP